MYNKEVNPDSQMSADTTNSSDKVWAHLGGGSNGWYRRLGSSGVLMARSIQRNEDVVLRLSCCVPVDVHTHGFFVREFNSEQLIDYCEDIGLEFEGEREAASEALSKCFAEALKSSGVEALELGNTATCLPVTLQFALGGLNQSGTVEFAKVVGGDLESTLFHDFMAQFGAPMEAEAAPSDAGNPKKKARRDDQG